MKLKKAFEFCLNLFPTSSSPISFTRKPLDYNLVAHAMGEWNSQPYLNCKEAFETNYQKGIRLFETDISLTEDNKIVFFHDGHEERFGLKKNFKESEFLNAHPFGATLLNLKMLGELINRFPDVKIITDVKDNNFKVLQEMVSAFESLGLNPKSIIIPQIYHPDEFKEIKKLGFEQYIFTVYRFKKRKNLVARFLRKNKEISALTVPDKWIEKKNYLKLAKKCQIDIFVHSIKEESRKNHLYSKGVKGIYTPNLF